MILQDVANLHSFTQNGTQIVGASHNDNAVFATNRIFAITIVKQKQSQKVSLTTSSEPTFDYF